MKTILLSLSIFIFSTVLCAAQPVLRNFENLAPGSKSTYLTADGEGVVAGKGGESVTWNFSKLVMLNDTIKEQKLLPSQTPKGSEFPAANLAESRSDGNVTYLKQTPDTTYFLGVIEPNFGLTIKYKNPYTFISRPFTYADTLTDTHARTYNLQGADYSGSGTSLSTADGFGSLILNGKVYDNVLRIRYEQRTNDTSAVDGSVLTITTISYAWYDTLHASALLKIDSLDIKSDFFNQATKQVYILQEEFNSSVEETVMLLAKVKAFISNGNLVLRSEENEVLQNVNIQIINAAGQCVMNKKLSNLSNTDAIISLQDQGLKAGMYFVKLNYKRNNQQLQDCLKVMKLN